MQAVSFSEGHTYGPFCLAGPFSQNYSVLGQYPKGNSQEQ